MYIENPIIFIISIVLFCYAFYIYQNPKSNESLGLVIFFALLFFGAGLGW